MLQIENIYNFLINYAATKITVQNFLTFLALTLAYLAYSNSIEEKYLSWKSLLKSFLNELITMSAWLNAEYKADAYDKSFFNPGKHVLILTTISGEELIRRGINDLKIADSKYWDKVALFIERIKAFNSLIEHNSRIVSADPIQSQRLRDILERYGISNQTISSIEFRKRISKNTKLVNSNLGKLMQQVLDSNMALHNELISDKNRQDRLSYLYKYLTDETKRIVSILESGSQIPFYIKHKWLIIIIFTILYFYLEYYIQ